MNRDSLETSGAEKEWPVGRLAVGLYADRKSLGQAAGQAVASRIKSLLASQSHVNIVFAAAPSQDELLDALASSQGIDWGRVNAFHMDEYVGLPPGAIQRFAAYLDRHIFRRVAIGQVHYLDGNAPDVTQECSRYTDLLRSYPTDIVCAGIGENGHLAFNDPGVADFLDDQTVKSVLLDVPCRQQQVNDGCFERLAQVPKQALTLTVPALMAARWIYCVVPGKTKAAAVKAALTGPITPQLPASILRIHPRCVLYLDHDSAAGLAPDAV